jgi:membrane associated rhomboid family serine protease
MRISRAGLIVAIVIMVPIIIELRTVFVHLGLDVSLAQTALLGAIMIGALILWAMAPDIRHKRRSNGE